MKNNCRLSLGTAQFGLNYGIGNQLGRMSLAEAKKIITFAQLSGINSLDTAIAYGDAEKRLGGIGIPNWEAVSKLPGIDEDCGQIEQLVLGLVNKSKDLLGIESLYGLLLHRPAQLLEKHGEEIYGSLMAAKKNGLVKKIGISIYDPSELDLLLARFQFDLVQAPLNVFDNRIVDSGWMSGLARSGIELQVRSVFLQGLLLFDKDARPAQFKAWNKILTAWDNWVLDMKMTPVEACLNHVLSFTHISKVIVGVDTLSQLKNIIASVKEPYIKIPSNLKTTDCQLINPANWQTI
jgi:aryl-alcohol dehydrogenase-like predicted oxidoreductase